MKSTPIIIILFLAVAVFIIIYSSHGGQSPEEYADEVLHEREEKDLFMKNSSDSPFAGTKEGFGGLAYFPPDVGYLIKATLIPIKDKKMIVLSTSDGQEKKYLEHAYAEFELNGTPVKLLILEITDPGPDRGTLFLAFADETSSRETYGAGRYLDLKKIPGASSVLLDFNKAYNPYCAYSDSFSCPFPPRENLLKVAIRAGEKSYH